MSNNPNNNPAAHENPSKKLVGNEEWPLQGALTGKYIFAGLWEATEVGIFKTFTIETDHTF